MIEANHKDAYNFTVFLHGKLASRPDLGHIEGVETKLGWVGLLWLHDLNVGCPLWVCTVLNLVVELLLGVVRVFTTNAVGLLPSELLLSLLGDEVVFDVDKAAICVDPLESVATISVLLCPSIRSSVVGEEHHSSVVTIRSLAQLKEVSKNGLKAYPSGELASKSKVAS